MIIGGGEDAFKLVLREISKEIKYKLTFKCQEGFSSMKIGVWSIPCRRNELSVLKNRKTVNAAGTRQVAHGLRV